MKNYNDTLLFISNILLIKRSIWWDCEEPKYESQFLFNTINNLTYYYNFIAFLARFTEDT